MGLRSGYRKSMRKLQKDITIEDHVDIFDGMCIAFESFLFSEEFEKSEMTYDELLKKCSDTWKEHCRMFPRTRLNTSLMDSIYRP